MPTRKLPPALIKNASKVASRATAKLAAEGRVLIAFIQERKEAIAAAFYDIGEALVKLKKPGIAEARGHEGFYAMCDAELGLKATQVDELVDIATHLTRKDAIKLGQSKAGALARLGGFDFIRITNSTNAVFGPFGERSAEICGVADARPATIPRESALRARPQEVKRP